MSHCPNVPATRATGTHHGVAIEEWRLGAGESDIIFNPYGTVGLAPGVAGNADIAHGHGQPPLISSGNDQLLCVAGVLGCILLGAQKPVAAVEASIAVPEED